MYRFVWGVLLAFAVVFCHILSATQMAEDIFISGTVAPAGSDNLKIKPRLLHKEGKLELTEYPVKSLTQEPPLEEGTRRYAYCPDFDGSGKGITIVVDEIHVSEHSAKIRLFIDKNRDLLITSAEQIRTGAVDGSLSLRWGDDEVAFIYTSTGMLLPTTDGKVRFPLTLQSIQYASKARKALSVDFGPELVGTIEVEGQSHHVFTFAYDVWLDTDGDGVIDPDYSSAESYRPRLGPDWLHPIPIGKCEWEYVDTEVIKGVQLADPTIWLRGGPKYTIRFRPARYTTVESISGQSTNIEGFSEHVTVVAYFGQNRPETDRLEESLKNRLCPSLACYHILPDVELSGKKNLQLQSYWTQLVETPQLRQVLVDAELIHPRYDYYPAVHLIDQSGKVRGRFALTPVVFEQAKFEFLLDRLLKQCEQ